jgi:hypothetical protein
LYKKNKPKTFIIMETQDLQNQNPSHEDTTSLVSLSQAAIDNLQKTAPWMTFIAIVACGAGVLMCLAALLSLLFRAGGGVGSGADGVVFLLYLPIGISVIYANVFLFSAANSIKTFCRTSGKDDWETGLLLTRKYWKTTGILAIVSLSILLLSFFSFLLVV